MSCSEIVQVFFGSAFASSVMFQSNRLLQNPFITCPCQDHISDHCIKTISLRECIYSYGVLSSKKINITSVDTEVDLYYDHAGKSFFATIWLISFSHVSLQDGEDGERVLASLP